MEAANWRITLYYDVFDTVQFYEQYDVALRMHYLKAWGLTETFTTEHPDVRPGWEIMSVNPPTIHPDLEFKKLDGWI